jgi:hypothetical protein
MLERLKMKAVEMDYGGFVEAVLIKELEAEIAKLKVGEKVK